MTRRPQPTVVVSLHDGFYGCGTGAGYANHALLRILTGLLPAQARLVVLPVRLDPASAEYDPTWHGATITLLNQVDALVHPVDNGTRGPVRLRRLGLLRPPRPRPRRRPAPPRPTGRRPGPDPGPGRPVPRARTAAAHQGGAEPRLGAPLHRPHPRTTGPQPH